MTDYLSAIKEYKVASTFLFADSFGVPILKLEKIILNYKRHKDWELINAKLEIELSDYVDTDNEFYKCLIEIDKISEKIKKNEEGLQKWHTLLNGLEIAPLKI